jgi:hypothetical protein
MKYDLISDGASVLTGMFALSNIQDILSIIILVLSIANIIINMIMRIYHHIKNKEYDEIPNEIDKTTKELEKIKEENKNEKGGYIIIDLQSALIVNDLRKALDSNKPVLVYDANNDANFYTLSYDGDSEVYTLTGANGGYTIDEDGVVTPVAPSGASFYTHNVTIQKDSDSVVVNVVSSKSTALTFSELTTLLGVANIGVLGTGSKPVGLGINAMGILAFDDTPIMFDNTSTITDVIAEI